ncbi:MAG: hypothetical protein K8R17_11395, partial [Methanosarcinales archaeon]|nr:hypothetical protein [Methanosarcinales archaeon]
LHRMRRSANVFAIREITPDYWAPLGVWVVREAAREAVSSVPVRFDSVNDALNDMSLRINTVSKMWRPESKLLDRKMKQKRLMDFL